MGRSMAPLGRIVGRMGMKKPLINQRWDAWDAWDACTARAETAPPRSLLAPPRLLRSGTVGTDPPTAAGTAASSAIAHQTARSGRLQSVTGRLSGCTLAGAKNFM